MEESYETFQEELWPPRADASPLKPVRQIRRPGEMYTSRKIKEETPLAPQLPNSEPKMLPREPSFSKPSLASVQKPVSIQNRMQTETPWENVTLNRCLIVAITILVLTSGFQKLHEAFRSQGTTEEGDAGLKVQSRLLQHRGAWPEPETSLWDSVFWWLPSLDDEEEEDEDDEDIKRKKSKRGASRGLRNRPLPDKKLLKQRDGKLKDRRAKKARDDKIKDKKGRVEMEDHEDAADEEDERDEEAVGKKYRKMKNQKEKA